MFNTGNPKFSIIISTYNRAEILKQALDSVCSQTFKDFEIIVSDDASGDNTKQIVYGFNDVRINYLCNKNNSGLSVTRNSAFWRT